MTEKQFKFLKEDYIDHLKQYVNEAGGIFPHLTVFADQISDDIPLESDEQEYRPSIIHIPIPDKYMNDNETKDDFIENVVPDLFETIKKTFIPKGIAWASEAWMRVVEKDMSNIPQKKEVIIINIEYKDGNESMIYEITRGKLVNEEGKLVEYTNLNEITNEKNCNLSGRFTGLFKLF